MKKRDWYKVYGIDIEMLYLGGDAYSAPAICTQKTDINSVQCRCYSRLIQFIELLRIYNRYYVKEGTDSWKTYYTPMNRGLRFTSIFCDYLGSITHIANSDGSLKQELSYDAWGRLRNPATQVAYTPGSEPALFIGRGYTGHSLL